jgi:hypothetical protein
MKVPLFLLSCCFFVENAVVLGFGLILKGKLFSSYLFFFWEKNSQREIPLLLQHKSK